MTKTMIWIVYIDASAHQIMFMNLFWFPLKCFYVFSSSSILIYQALLCGSLFSIWIFFYTFDVKVENEMQTKVDILIVIFPQKRSYTIQNYNVLKSNYFELFSTGKYSLVIVILTLVVCVCVYNHHLPPDMEKVTSMQATLADNFWENCGYYLMKDKLLAISTHHYPQIWFTINN